MNTATFLQTRRVFNVEDARRTLTPRGSTATMQERLKYYVRTRRLLPVTRGVYAAVPLGLDAGHFHPDPFLVAATVRPDAVFAFYSALTLLGAARVDWNGVTVVTSRRRRPVHVAGGVRLDFLAVAPALARLHKQGVGLRSVDRTGRELRGGRKVRVAKPRVRDVEVGREVALPTWGLVTDDDPLERRALEQMLVGVSTREYPRSLEPLPAGMESLSVSRRFVSRTAAEVDAYLSRSLEGCDIPVVMIDGTGLGEHTLVVALGIDVQGCKHVLGARLGSTENETLGRELLSSLVERGLSLERARLFVIDGSKGLRKAIRAVFGEWALVQRCTVHKLRNVLDHLPEVDKVWVRTSLRRAWQSSDQAGAQRLLKNLAQQLEKRHPDAAASLREGLEETTTLLRLGVGSTLYRTLCVFRSIVITDSGRS